MFENRTSSVQLSVQWLVNKTFFFFPMFNCLTFILNVAFCDNNFVFFFLSLFPEAYEQGLLYDS